MTRINRRLSAVAILAGAAIALAGCAGSPSSSSTSVKSSSLKGTGWTSAERADIADGGTLTIPVDTIPQNYNIAQKDSGTVDDQAIDGLFYANFVLLNEDGSWAPNPDYATSLKLVSTSPEVVELKINPKAVWSNGKPIDVEDIKATWQALNGKTAAYAPLATNVWEDVSSVEQGTDAKDVKITFSKPNADWPSVLNNTIVPSFAQNTPEAFNTAWAKGPVDPATGKYVSGGPFVVSKIDQTGQVLTFERNPKWWGDAPKLDTVIFKAVSRSQLAQAFSNREIDVMNFYGSADNYATAQKRTDAQIERSLGTTYRHVTLNGTSAVFSDAKVRQAFAQSINRETIAQSRLSAVDSPIELMNSLIYMPGQKGYQDNASKVIGYDTASADKLLDEAGWKKGSDGIREKDGKKLSVRFVIPADTPASSEVAQQVQAQTKITGFDVKIDSVPSNDFFSKYITVPERDFDATYFAWQGTPFPVSSVKSIYYPADSGQNYPGITQEKLGGMWDKANGELDPAKQVTLANDIDKVIVAQAQTIPLFPEPYAWAVKKGLVNYGPSQFQSYSVQWQNVGFAK